MTEVGEEHLGLGALAGQPDDVLDLGAGAAAARAFGVVGTAAPREQTSTPSIAMSSARGAVPGSAAPTAWAIRPQFGSAPWSAVFTSGEFATARAAASTASRVPSAGDDPPDALRALTVGDDHEGELAKESVQRLAEAQLVLDSGATATPLAPLAWRITVSLVESWPSTEIRSKERLTHTPSSRSAVSGSSAASVCTKHSMVAKAG